MLKGKRILIGVTGGIAAYKVPLLIREFRKAGAEVRVVMTDSAREFVTPLTLSTLSAHEVVLGTFPKESSHTLDAGTWHIDLGRWADAMIIAPATANTLAKLAGGYADNAVTTLALALRCPLIVAPSMDTDMYLHASTQENILSLRETGCFVIPPEEGELASGLTGQGRLPETGTIVRAVDGILSRSAQDLKGKRILVTAGPTHEPVDPVRFIGNRSSGKMGFSLANAAAIRGASVTLIAGPVALRTPRNVRRIDVETAGEMHRAVMAQAKDAHAVIMAAAVADFTPAHPVSSKIKKPKHPDKVPSLILRQTRDILADLSRRKHRHVTVGFALETENGPENARAKLREKHLDFIVLNNPLVSGSGFGSDTNAVTIISKSGRAEKIGTLPKFEVANLILDRVIKILKR